MTSTILASRRDGLREGRRLLKATPHTGDLLSLLPLLADLSRDAETADRRAFAAAIAEVLSEALSN
jgi:hypothetical protein